MVEYAIVTNVGNAQSGMSPFGSLWEILLAVYFFPGNVMIKLLLTATPDLAVYLDITERALNATGAGVLSLMVWAFALFGIGKLWRGL